MIQSEYVTFRSRDKKFPQLIYYCPVWIADTNKFKTVIRRDIINNFANTRISLSKGASS